MTPEKSAAVGSASAHTLPVIFLHASAQPRSHEEATGGGLFLGFEVDVTILMRPPWWTLFVGLCELRRLGADKATTSILTPPANAT